MNNAIYHANGVWPEVKTFPAIDWSFTPYDTDVFPQPPHRILVTGWRDWPETHAKFVWQMIGRQVLQMMMVPGESSAPIVIVHGECPYGGVDLWAHQYAVRNRNHGIMPEPHPAEITPRGLILGPARNARMVKAGASACVGFPGPNSRGTTDCMNKARAAGIPTFEYPWEEARGLPQVQGATAPGVPSWYVV